MTREITAIDSKNRIKSLDVLRGFALFGIGLVNIFGFNASFFDFGGFYNSLPDPSEQKFYQSFFLLTVDKFIFIYSFLFGYGFYLQYYKYGSQDLKFTRYYSRRLLFLALFGLAHIFFLWAGDILLLYAIASFVLLFIRKFSVKVLLVFGFIFYFFISIWLIFSIWLPLPNGLSSTCTECLNDAMQIYPTGNYLECLKLRLLEYYSFRNINIFYYLPKILGTFIFGFLASKHMLHKRIQNNRGIWAIVSLGVFFIGLLLLFYYENWVSVLTPANSKFLDAMFMGAYELMNLFLGFAYILIILLLASFKFNILNPLAYVGRMSLTNYIMQSVLFSIIFYGWGFGKFGMQQPTTFIWFAVGVFIFQLIFSYFWLKTKEQGPLEWIWRTLSYKKH